MSPNQSIPTQVTESPQLKFINSMLRFMNKNNGTDLFICAGTKAQLKINNELKPVTDEVLKPALIKELIMAITPKNIFDRLETELEANFATSLPGIARFRVNVYVQRGTYGMVIRHIQTEIPTMESLKLPDHLKELVMSKRGLVIIVGGTGTGKSTTLASMIDYRNKNSSGHIITIEDPVEFVHQHAKCIVSQREIGTDTLNWRNALKNTLRQAPDVILIGEVRDMETMNHAIEFSQTGHLCLCTLHANNTYQALERIVNLFPHQQHTQLYSDLSMNLRGIVSQRLVTAIEGGRRAALETLINTPLIADLIAKGEIGSIREVMARNPESGNTIFDDYLVSLVQSKIISLDEALKNAESKTEIKVKLRSRGIAITDVDESQDKKLHLRNTESEGTNSKF
ncbi:MAG: PilT/PilU family type 4a pilus ATPase [Methylacidiphilales bacterium]|nr:PilT/PilU family type 4a pilus ATPase [Candidatus Methylacidiphilales bacterium]